MQDTQHHNTSHRPPLVWVSAAETSADMHGAELIASLERQAPQVAVRGMGGPAMRRQAFTADFRSEQLSVMGLTEVIEFLPRILRLLRQTRQRLADLRPDVVVVIDSPDYHFRIARAAHKLGIPVVYYIAPQAWAWRKGRVRFLRRFVDKLLCILPFEQEWFREHGVDTEFVGHPFMDQIDFRELRTLNVSKQRIALLPGSRMKEVKVLLPRFAEAARLLLARHPDLRFVLVQAPSIEKPDIRALWPADLPLTIIEAAERYREIRRSRVALAASGTATLECALLGTPTVVSYAVSSLSYLVGRLLIKVPFIAMPNLILGERVFPEYIQHQATGPALAGQVSSWLQNPEELDTIHTKLETLPERLGLGGASDNAARAVLQQILPKTGQSKGHQS